MSISNRDYWVEVRSIAAGIAEEAVEQAKDNDPDLEQDDVKEAAEEIINDTLLHETIDGHEWIIYTAYHLPILQWTDNADYMVDNLGGADDVLKSSGVDGLHQALAFWALYADVQECIDDALDSELGED